MEANELHKLDGEWKGSEFVDSYAGSTDLNINATIISKGGSFTFNTDGYIHNYLKVTDRVTFWGEFFKVRYYGDYVPAFKWGRRGNSVMTIQFTGPDDIKIERGDNNVVVWRFHRVKKL